MQGLSQQRDKQKNAVVGELGESPQNEKKRRVTCMHKKSFLEAEGDGVKRKLGSAAALLYILLICQKLR